MCGRYTLRRVDLIRSALGAVPLLPFEEFTGRPRYNVAPSQAVPLVCVDDVGRRVIKLANWGFTASWAKTLPKVRPINARAETVAASGLFRRAFDRSRCLIPADGFYEWRKAGSGNGAKQPFFIHFRDDRPFAFAGLCERWKPPEGKAVDTCTIITTEPNDLMRPVHDRMPVIVRPEDYTQWLSRDVPGREVQKLLRPIESGDMEARAISDRVNRPSNDGPELIAAAAT